MVGSFYIAEVVNSDNLVACTAPDLVAAGVSTLTHLQALKHRLHSDVQLVDGQL